MASVLVQGRGMAICLYWTVLMVILMYGAQATQFQVGGPPGWTLPSIANVNYTAWEGTQTFVVGDTLYFNYSKEYHNVMEVTRAEYESCNASSPVSTFDDGATVIALDRPGTFYFLCGVPSHCSAGQKVAVKVRKHALPSTSSSQQNIISPSPVVSPTPTTSPPLSSHTYAMNDNGSPLSSSFPSLIMSSSLLLFIPLLLLII